MRSNKLILDLRMALTVDTVQALQRHERYERYLP